MNDLISKEDRIRTIEEGFVKESLASKLVFFDYTKLIFDNNQLFQINTEILMENKNLTIIYSELINEFMMYYNIDFCLSFTDLCSVYYNSCLTYRKNQDVYFINQKVINKKSIAAINNLLSKYGKQETVNRTGIVIPLMFKSLEKVSKVLSVINLFKNLVNIDRIFILSIYDINISPEDQSKINSLVNKFKETNIEFNLIDKSLIKTFNVFDCLLKNKVIDEKMYKKISMFLNPTVSEQIDTFEKIVQNTLFLRLKKIIQDKKSKVCLGLENIEDTTEVVKYTNLLGEYISAIKINSNFIYNESLLKGLKRLAEHHRFIIIDDRKIGIKNITDLKKLNLFKYVDAVCIKLEFISEEIDKWFQDQRKAVNEFSSFILHADEETIDIVRKQYSYFNNIILGVSGLEKTDNEMFTILDYKHVSNLNDNFIGLKNADLVILEDELYKSKNPLEIVNKINLITHG